jgi:hypothetical protein
MAPRESKPKTKSKRGATASRSSIRPPKHKRTSGARTTSSGARATSSEKRGSAKPATSRRAAIADRASSAREPSAHAVMAGRGAPSGAIVLGSITVPSGTLAVFDIGLVGYLPRPALEPAIITASVPRDRELPVVGERVGRGRYADCWDHVAIRIGDGEIVASKKLGDAGVDFARIACMDLGTLDAWQHEDSLDGKADIVFWGRDAAQLARSMSAPRTQEGYGWTDLTVAQAEAKADEIARRKAANKWLLASDLRPHSHHFHALAAARANPYGAGTLEVGGARMLLFFTSWGDGVFPVHLDRDHQGRPVRIRIQLQTDDSHAALAAVNP